MVNGGEPLKSNGIGHGLDELKEEAFHLEKLNEGKPAPLFKVNHLRCYCPSS
jgi:hypothetical protein